MKLIIENWRKFIAEAELNEATDEDLEMIKDAMALSPVALPFNDLFGNKRRKLLVIGNENVYEMDFLLKQFHKKVSMKKYETIKQDGRKITDTVPTVTLGSAEMKFNKTEGKVEPRPEIKIEEISLEKFISSIIKLKKQFPGYKQKFDMEELNHNQMVKIANTFIKYFFPTQDADGDSILYNKYVKEKGEIVPIMSRLLARIPNIPAFQDIERLQNIYVQTKKDLIKKDSIWRPVKESFVILSRDPIDVFRMSDHQGLQSCHSLPASRKSLGASPSKPVWDEYNICAAAEAHGNGAIAYSVDKDEFEKEVGPLSQETLDNLDGKEIFADSMRNVDGVTPTGRVRIRKLRFDNTEFATLEKRTYGKFPAGVRDDLFEMLTNIQSEKFKNLNIGENNIVDLDKGERYGGKYEDNGVTELFSNMLEKYNIISVGELQYNEDFQDSLKGITKPDWISLWQEINNGDHDDNNEAFELRFEVDFDPDDEDYWDEDYGDQYGTAYVGGAVVLDLSLIPQLNIDVERFIEDVNNDYEENDFTREIQDEIGRSFDYTDREDFYIEAEQQGSSDQIKVTIHFSKMGYGSNVQSFLNEMKDALYGAGQLYNNLDDEDELRRLLADYIVMNIDLDGMNEKIQDSINYSNSRDIVQYDISEGQIDITLSFPFQISQETVDAFSNANIKPASTRATVAQAFFDDFKVQGTKLFSNGLRNAFENSSIEKDELDHAEKHVLSDFRKGATLIGFHRGNNTGTFKVRLLNDLLPYANENGIKNLAKVFQFAADNKEDMIKFCENYWEDSIPKVLSIKESKKRSIKLKILRG